MQSCDRRLGEMDRSWRRRKSGVKFSRDRLVPLHGLLHMNEVELLSKCLATELAPSLPATQSRHEDQFRNLPRSGERKICMNAYSPRALSLHFHPTRREGTNQHRYKPPSLVAPRGQETTVR